MPGLKLVAELGGDGSGYDAMMRRANATKDKFASAFSGLKNVVAGAFTVGAITNLSRRTIEFASHLRDVSDALRVNVEWFQKRANAAKLTGGSEDDLFKLLDQLNKSRSAAVQQPGGAEAQTFGRLGFSGAEISGLNPMAFFDKLVKAYGDGANAQTAVDVEKVGGRSARNLLAAFGNQFQSDAAVMSEEMVDALDDIGDEFTILGNQLLIEFAPVIKTVAEAVAWALGKMKVGLSGWQGFWNGYLEKATQQVRQDGKTGWAGYFANVAEGLEEGWKQMLGEAAAESANQGTLASQTDAAKARARELRRRRENSTPGFEPLELDADKSPARRSAPASDSLVGIGNFLGRNPSLVNSVANQQLQVARTHLGVAQQTLTAIQNLKLRETSPGILVPGI